MGGSFETTRLRLSGKLWLFAAGELEPRQVHTVRHLLSAPNLFAHLVPLAISWLVPVQTRLVRSYVSAKRNQFATKLEQDLAEHGSFAFGMLRSAPCRPRHDDLADTANVWDEVWRGKQPNTVVSIAKERVQKLVAQGKVNTAHSHITVEEFQHVA